MFVLDQSIFIQALRKSPYKSIQGLADALGIHRNTIHYYLTEHPVIPTKLTEIFDALDLVPGDCIKKKTASAHLRLEPIAPIIDALHRQFPEVSFCLFGSRSKAKPHAYSDWDIGVFASKEISHALFRQIRKACIELTENFPYFVELVNLNQADYLFLKEISKTWKFLTGHLQDWLALQKKVLT